MSIKGKYVGMYRKAETGNAVFKYALRGTTEELAKYETSKGKYFIQDDDGVPLLFSNRNFGNNIEMLETSKGQFVVNEEKTLILLSLMDQYGPEKGAAVFKMQFPEGVNSAPVAAPVATAEDAVVDDANEEL